MMNYLFTKNILSDARYGFRSPRSCENQLIMLVSDIARSLNDGGQLDAGLLDFSRAFDKVNHRNLCLKLEHYGISTELLNWIKNYQNIRTQEVIVEGKISDSFEFISGVLKLQCYKTYVGPIINYVNCHPKS